MTTAKQNKFLAITKMEGIAFVMEGVASDASGFIVTEDATEEIINAVEAGEAAIAQVQTLQGQLTEAQTAQQTAEGNLANANATIQTLQARVAELEKQVPAGGNPGATDGDPDPSGDELGAMDMPFQKELLNKI